MGAVLVVVTHSLPSGPWRLTSLPMADTLRRPVVQLCTHRKEVQAQRALSGVYVSLPRLHLSLCKWLLNHRAQ